jgi:prepilin-type processing-associated H-X9-DG protein
MYADDSQSFIPNKESNWVVQQYCTADSTRGANVYVLWEGAYATDGVVVCPATPLASWTKPDERDDPPGGRWALRNGSQYVAPYWDQWKGVKAMVNRGRTGTCIYVGGGYDRAYYDSNYPSAYGGRGRRQLQDIRKASVYGLWQDRVEGISTNPLTWQDEFNNHSQRDPKGGNVAFADGSTRWLALSYPVYTVGYVKNGDWWAYPYGTGYMPLGQPDIVATSPNAIYQRDDSVIDLYACCNSY